MSYSENQIPKELKKTGFEEALTKAFLTGWTTDAHNPPDCYTSIKHYEVFYCCEECPLNAFCEEENAKFEEA